MLLPTINELTVTVAYYHQYLILSPYSYILLTITYMNVIFSQAESTTDISNHQYKHFLWQNNSLFMFLASLYARIYLWSHNIISRCMSLQTKLNARPQAESKCRSMLKTYYKNARINALYQKYLSIEKEIQNTSFLGEHTMRAEDDNLQKKPDSVFDERVKKYKIVKVENDFQLEKTNFLLVSERKANSSFFQRNKTKYHPSQSSCKTLLDQKSQNQNIIHLKEKEYPFEIDFQASRLKLKRRKSQMTRLYNNDSRNSKSAGEKVSRNHNKLLYFEQLKNYPKIVEFTIERKIKKQNKKEEDKKQKDKRKKQFVRRMENQRGQRARSKDQTIDASPPPMKTSLLIQNHLRKIYTKVSKKTFVPQSHQIDMQNFIKKQQNLLFQNREICLSENTQLKLKEDLNKIAFNLCTSRRKHQNSFRSKMVQ